MSPILGTILAVVGILATILVSVAYAWAQLKNGKSNADSSTIVAYRGEVDALKLRVTRLEEEKTGLTAQVNQLIGENKNLKETLTYQDPAFRDTIKRILEEIKQIRLDDKVQVELNRKHSELDDKRFNKIFGLLDAKQIAEKK